ncbi:hypothetical protein ND16A_1814 [Thalassotalea sp. ND16A]|nr:hypothetical protein ND16A_1814 [Thalassotalea sp. ND16A]
MKLIFLKAFCERVYVYVRLHLLTEERYMRLIRQKTVAQLTATSINAANRQLTANWTRLFRVVVLALGLVGAVSVTNAADVYLEAQSFTKTLPAVDGGEIVVPMWGFASCADDSFNGCEMSATGPQINMATGDSLTIHLNNTLSTPVSIGIPGQAGGGNPQWSIDGSGRRRVRSFTHETSAGTTGSYTWSSLKTGTYLYQSGTHPSIQVPMGLYGALVVAPVVPASTCTTSAYNHHNSCFDAETVLLFSEIDPRQNAAVDAAAGDSNSYPSTVDYSPTYLLINGEVSVDPLPAGQPGDRVLLRYLNAGLRSHTPTIVGLDMGLIAEDGNPYPGLIKKQSTALLAAGKTLDVLVEMPNEDITLAFFDHMPTFSNDALPNGGMLANLQVGTGTPAPLPATTYAVDDNYDVLEDTVMRGSSVLDNDSNLLGAEVAVVKEPSNGVLRMRPSGEFRYSPNANFTGRDGFNYSASLGGNTYSAQVTLNVSFENDSPLAAADGPYVNAIGPHITVAAPGILGNDSDPDGDRLVAAISGAAPAGLTLNSDGSFEYTGGVSTSFSYTASDGVLSSAPVMVTLNINPLANIALIVQEPGGGAVTNYRWLVEEDTMWQPDPSIAPPPVDTLGTNFHKSYMPIVAQGCNGTEIECGVDLVVPFAELALDPLKHYYVSILPTDAASGTGHSVGGAQILPGATAVTVTVNSQPLPYAQISVYVFEDSSPTNGAVDGGEQGLGLGGFQITLEDAGGRYGASGGTMMQDANGDMLRNSLDCFDSAPPVGVILTCPNTPSNVAAGVVGEALIKNLYPGKYGIIAAAPPGGDQTWTQTSTIEGSKIIDAWVRAGEASFFQEFGPNTWHVFVGFVNPDNLILPAGGSNAVSGKITNLHMSRPPKQTLWDSGSYDALAHTRAWVGLNSAGGNGPNIAAVQADADGNFEITDVPDGNYQLVVWDNYLDQVIAYRGVTVNGSGAALGNVPVFQWFTRTEHNVYLDANANGVRDSGEAPVAEQAVNLRWRDGTVNQSFPTDIDGFVPFDQTFPFFHWQVLEVDFTRFKATGLTVTVDGGGDVSTGDYPGLLNPQIQADGVSTTRTETGPVLTQGFQGFLGQTSIFDWGKAPYLPGENGGISGIVYYASTRAENDPRLAAGEPWEPGIPSVKVRLYREVATSSGGTALALMEEVETDSWDSSLPTGCPGFDPSDTVITGGPEDKCYDGLRNFNQARPAVFDGGYAFMDIPSGKYVVEVVPPPGYDLLKEEDNNVSFGDVFANAPVAILLPGGAAISQLTPDPALVAEAMASEPGLAQPPCVGALRQVPEFLSLFPSESAEAPFAGAMRPLCDRKEVVLSDQGQAAADFFLFTGAPVAGHVAGMILDDLAQEFNIYSPQFGEKWAPPFVPVSVRDYQGNEISRVYSDQWGRFNGLVPSTFTANMPSPSGFSPAMHITCMNDPGPIPGPDGQLILDPQYNAAYSNFCYTFQYMPGTTTYLDTPVLPVSAFASGYNAPDCALDDGTPMISSAGSSGNSGPWALLRDPTDRSTTRTVDIKSAGSMLIPNPAYEGPLATGQASHKMILRDFGFGAASANSTVTVDGVPLTVNRWTNDRIRATIDAQTPVAGELVVTRGDNGSTNAAGLTFTVSDEVPLRVPADYPTIQQAIDAATPGALILVAPGTYNELVIMWKPVRLQGSGAGSTFINAAKGEAEAMVMWRAKMDCLFGIGAGCTQVVNGLPTQQQGAGGFGTEEGAAITVVGVFDSGRGQPPANSFLRGSAPARIDGFSITGAEIGGGIFVNGNAHRIEIANNNVFGNSGLFAGGIRIGRPFLELTGNGPFGFSTGVNIHHNNITQNGGLGGAGGGLSIAVGTDDYTLSSNFVCGNFTTGDGGGIGHLGLSDNGLIKDNRIVFNQSFAQAVTRSGGGLFIAGEPPVGDGLSHGSGNVTVDTNIIQGNQAGAGHGGGIRTQFVNGRDIVDSINRRGRARPGQWYGVTINNNTIVNNVAGWSGGGVSLQDTALSLITNNTISHNDSTATVSAAFTIGNVNVSANQPAGISSEPHSPALTAAIPAQSDTNNHREFSNPKRLSNNILWRNRSFYYDANGTVAGLVPNLSQSYVGECAVNNSYLDLGVLGNGFILNPTSSVLTDTTGYHTSNTDTDPGFGNPYCNGGRTLLNSPGEMSALPALDEGGAAWIDVRYGPLTQSQLLGSLPWNYDAASE